MLNNNQNKQEVFVHIDNLVQYIATELNLNPKKMSLITTQKIVVSNEHNNYQTKAFDKLTVIFNDKNTQSEYEFEEKKIKELISKNLNVEPQFIELQYFCNIKPSSNSNAQLNYIGVTSNSPDVKLTLDTKFNKIEQMRKKYLYSKNSNNAHITM